MEEKKCYGCGKIYPFTNQYFNYRNKSEGVLHSRCKSCTNKAIKKGRVDKERLFVYVSSKDKNMIEKNAKKIGWDISKYIRYVAVKNQPVIIKDLIELEPVEEAFGNIEYQMRKLGNNVNQIAKSLNSGGSVSQDTANALVNVLEKLNLKMDNIAKTIAKAYESFD